MGYYVGDIPAQDLVIEPARNEEPVDLTLFDDLDIALYGPAGVPVETPGFLGTIEEGVIVIEWPSTSPFTEGGIYSFRITLRNDATGIRERFPAVRIVVDTEDGWHTLETARDDWRNAPGYDAWLYEILWVARENVLAYAPKLAEGQRPPINYLRAQIMQARNLWNAGKVDPASGGEGEDSFIMRPYPLDWMVKQVLRPARAVPVVG